MLQKSTSKTWSRKFLRIMAPKTDERLILSKNKQRFSTVYLNNDKRNDKKPSIPKQRKFMETLVLYLHVFFQPISQLIFSYLPRILQESVIYCLKIFIFDERVWLSSNFKQNLK